MGDLLDGMNALGEATTTEDPSILDAKPDFTLEKSSAVSLLLDKESRDIDSPILIERDSSLLSDMDTLAATTVTKPQHLTAMDYILDASEELAAGLAEGVTLQNIGFGDIGPDTTAGDVARFLGSVVGSVPPYLGIAAGLGYLGIGAGAVALPAALARGAATGFVGRALTGVLEYDEDTVDRLENSLIAAGFGATVSAMPFAFNKLASVAKGGPTPYMDNLKRNLKDVLIKKFKFSEDHADDAVLGFAQKVEAAGGAEKVSATLMKRAAKVSRVTAKEWLPLNRSVHGIAKRTLGLSVDRFHKLNMEQVGEAHTNKMSLRQLKQLRSFYKKEASLLKKVNKYLPDKMTYEQAQSAYTNFEPGIFSQHRPVERVMRNMGFGSIFDAVYDKEVARLNYVAAYDKVRKSFLKKIARTDRKRIFHLLDETKIPEGATLKDIKSALAKEAPNYGIANEKSINAATWLRHTYQKMLESQNTVLQAEGAQPILPREAYVTHLVEDTAKSLKGITPELWSIVRRKGAKKVFNSFLKERIGNVGIIEDAFKAHEAYTRAASKMIYLRPASRFAKNVMSNALKLQDGKKIPIKLPTNVRQYVNDWLDYGITEVAKNMDRHLNTTLQMSARSLAGRLKMASYRGHLLFNPSSVVRNVTQADLNYAKLGGYWVDGIKSLKPGKLFYENMSGWQFASRYCKLLQTRMVGFEGVDPTTLGALTKLGMSGFKAVDKLNIVSGFNGAFRKAVANGQSFGDAITTADKLVRNTQFVYLNIDRPLAWHGALGSLGTQYQSWWTRFLEEVWSWGGTMPYGDGSSRTIRIAKHAINVAKSKEMTRYLSFNLILLAALKSIGAGAGLVLSKLPVPGVSSGPLPTSIPPALNGLIGTGEALYGKLIGSDYLVQKGWRTIKREYPATIVPGYSAMRKLHRVASGQAPKKSLLVPVTKEEIEEFRYGY